LTTLATHTFSGLSTSASSLSPSNRASWSQSLPAHPEDSWNPERRPDSTTSSRNCPCRGSSAHPSPRSQANTRARGSQGCRHRPVPVEPGGRTLYGVKDVHIRSSAADTITWSQGAKPSVLRCGAAEVDATSIASGMAIPEARPYRRISPSRASAIERQDIAARMWPSCARNPWPHWLRRREAFVLLPCCRQVPRSRSGPVARTPSQRIRNHEIAPFDLWPETPRGRHHTAERAPLERVRRR
jgi:hypothetical protein